MCDSAGLFEWLEWKIGGLVHGAALPSLNPRLPHKSYGIFSTVPLPLLLRSRPREAVSSTGLNSSCEIGGLPGGTFIPRLRRLSAVALTLARSATQVYLSSKDGTELVAGYGTTGHDASETAATGSEFSAQWLIQNRFMDSRRCSA